MSRGICPVGTGTAAGSVVSTTVWVEAWADESDLSDLAVGSDAEMTLPAYPSTTFRGRVEALGVVSSLELPPEARSGIARSNDRSLVKVRIAFEADQPQVMPGLTATVGIDRRSQTSDAPGE